MSQEQYSSQPALGMPRSVRVSVIILTSVSVSALIAVLIVLGRER